MSHVFVIPAQAGTQGISAACPWVPAFAGTTNDPKPMGNALQLCGRQNGNFTAAVSGEFDTDEEVSAV